MDLSNTQQHPHSSQAPCSEGGQAQILERVMHSMASGAWFSREQLYMAGQALRDALMDVPQCYTCLPKKAELAGILERYKCPPPLYQTGHPPPPPPTPQYQPPTYHINSKVQIGNGWKAPISEDEEVLETEEQPVEVVEMTQPGIADAVVHIEKEVQPPAGAAAAPTMPNLEDEVISPPPEKKNKVSSSKTSGGAAGKK